METAIELMQKWKEEFAAILGELDIWIAKTKEAQNITDIKPLQKAILLEVSFDRIFHIAVKEKLFGNDIESILQMAKWCRDSISYRLSVLNGTNLFRDLVGVSGSLHSVILTQQEIDDINNILQNYYYMPVTREKPTPPKPIKTDCAYTKIWWLERE